MGSLSPYSHPTGILTSAQIFNRFLASSMEPRSFCRNSHGLGSPMLCFSGNVVVSTHAAQLVLHGHTKTSAMDLRDCGCQSANARSVMHGVLVPVVLQDCFGPKSNVLPNWHGSLWPQPLRLRQVSSQQPTQRQLSGSAGNRRRHGSARR